MSTRYYNPNLGRFINADTFAATGQGLLGNNMFAYCNNNPVVHNDPTGMIMVGLLNGGIENTFGGNGWSSTTSQTATDTATAVQVAPKDVVWEQTKDDLYDLAMLLDVGIAIYTFGGSMGWIKIPKSIDKAIATGGLIAAIWGFGEYVGWW